MGLRGILAIATMVSGCTLLTSADGLRVAGPGGTPGDGGDGGGFCASLATRPFLCDDFDGNPLPGPWSEVVATRGASVTVGDVATSLPRSVYFVSPSEEPPVDLAVALRRRLVGRPSRLVVSLMTRVEERGEDNFDLVVFRANGHEFGWEIDSDGDLRFDEDAPNPDGGDELSTTTPTTRSIALHQWAHVRLVVTIGSAVTAELFVDDASVGVVQPRPGAFGPDADLFVGDDSLDTSNAQWRVRVDDVVVELE